MTASMESKGRTRDGPGEVEESDSEDSIFFTQKVQKSTPDDASSSRLSRRSIPIAPRFLEPESSSEDEYVPKKGTRLPVYNFPFINHQRKVPKRGSISSGTNSAIHHSAVAGFFHCFSAMLLNGQSGNCLELLPSIDSDNEEITPITEDEKSDEEDIKIIDKQLFVYSLNPQITNKSQPWLKNKRKEATKPTKRSNTCQYSGETTMLRSSSKNPEVCSNERQNPVDGSDVALQEGYEPIVSSNFPTEKQSTLQNESVQLSTKVKQYTNLDGQNEDLTIFSQESVDLFEDYITTCPLPNRRKDKTLKKTNCNEETLPTKLTPASCNNEKQVKRSRIEEETELLEDNGDGAIRKRNKKKRKKKKRDLENVEKHGTSLAPFQTLDDGQFDNIAAVDRCVSIVSSDGRKHKRKKQTVSDCEEGGVLKELTPVDRGMDERQGNADPGNDDNGGTDSIVTQSEKSVRKKKKKKSRVSAETVENVPLLPSLSGESCQGEGKLRISTNGTESAEISKLLQETELGKKVKKIRKDNSDLYELDQRVEVTEMSKICIKSKPCGLKKKKSFQTIEKIPSDGSKSAATCPNASESSKRKNKNKGHSCDGDVVETIETDLQSDTVRRKKHKYRNSDQIACTPHVELFAASGRKKKRRRKEENTL